MGHSFKPFEYGSSFNAELPSGVTGPVFVELPAHRYWREFIVETLRPDHFDDEENPRSYAYGVYPYLLAKHKGGSYEIERVSPPWHNHGHFWGYGDATDVPLPEDAEERGWELPSDIPPWERR